MQTGSGPLRPAVSRPMQPRDGHVGDTGSHRAQPERHLRRGHDAGLRRPAAARDGRLSHLRHAQRGAVQRGAGLSCADRRPICRRAPPGHRQGRLVGHGGRAGPADRHRPLLRHLRQRAGRLHGLDRPAEPARRWHRPVGHRLPAGDHPRHGSRAEDADRPSGHSAAVRGAGWLDGRDAGAAMGGELPGRGVRRAADRLRGVPLGAEHRVPRGGAAGDLRRSRTGRPAATGRAGAFPRAAWRWRGCARTSPICRRRR